MDKRLLGNWIDLHYFELHALVTDLIGERINPIHFIVLLSLQMLKWTQRLGS